MENEIRWEPMQQLKFYPLFSKNSSATRPARLFETEFFVRQGTGRTCVDTVREAHENGNPVVLVYFTPSGMSDSAHVLYAAYDEAIQPDTYPADNLKVVVELTQDQQQALSPPNPYTLFEY